MATPLPPPHPQDHPRALLLLLLVVALPVQAGCYHYRVVSARPDPATDYAHRTTHALFWGLIQEDVAATDCLSNTLDEVRVSTNFAYLLVSVVTIGVWVPMEVEWRCAKRPTQEGEI